MSSPSVAETNSNKIHASKMEGYEFHNVLECQNPEHVRSLYINHMEPPKGYNHLTNHIAHNKTGQNCSIQVDLPMSNSFHLFSAS